MINAICDILLKILVVPAIIVVALQLFVYVPLHIISELGGNDYTPNGDGTYKRTK